MTLEALRTKLDSLGWENSQLEIENKRLRESNPDQAAMVDLKRSWNGPRRTPSTLLNNLEASKRN